MAKFIIQGGQPLIGSVRLGGAKNAGFKLMIAAGLAESESRILNLSYINDVAVTTLILKKLGLHLKKCGERTFFISPNGIKTHKLPQIAGQKTRGSTLFAGMLLAKTGRAVIPLPGGCVLGARPIDRHLKALEALGAQVQYQDKYVLLRAKKLKGTTFRFDKKTHTGTEAVLLASVKAQGRTVIENAGQEPEIDDMIKFLNAMGAKVRRTYPEKIIIDGVKKLSGAIHQVMPDRNEAVSYAVAALATKGDVVLENAQAGDLKVFLEKLEDVGAHFQINDFGIRFWYHKQLKATNIETQPAPGFMTDWQPLWTVLMTQARGVSEIIERVHNNRFQFAKQLNKMGARIKLYNPQVKEPEKFYEFDDPQNDPNLHAAQVQGPTQLAGKKVEVTDLRAGATLTIAALAAAGRSEIFNIEHIDRGYEDLDDKLGQLGAKIKRIR